MGWDRHELLWNGMGWDRKKCPMDKPEDLFACFVDLEKAYDRVSQDKLWKVL